MCLYPRMIKNPKYKPNKKNGGQPPFCFDNRVLYVPIGCGVCIECLKKKGREWNIRLNEEIRNTKNGKFITLTFDQDSLKELRKEAEKYISEQDSKKKYKIIKDNEVARIAVRRFLERWRKKYKKSVRHWLVTELGHNGTERIHLHGLIFTDENKETIGKIWSYGMIWIGEYVNEKTINYIVKYIHKQDEVHKNYVPKVLTSAGIGNGYIKRDDSKRNKYKEETDESYKFRNGSVATIPIYYRNKIYTEEEREKLWIEKLDKKIRYIGGEKLRNPTDEQIIKLLKWHQEKNERLGYGNINWRAKDYEKKQEEIKKGGLALSNESIETDECEQSMEGVKKFTQMSLIDLMSMFYGETPYTPDKNND